MIDEEIKKKIEAKLNCANENLKYIAETVYEINSDLETARYLSCLMQNYTKND